MKRFRRRFLATMFLLAAGAVLFLYGLNRLTHEPDNYALIEDGLFLGGAVAEPPRGTSAVLNLCEREDPYHCASHDWKPIPDAEPAPTLDWLRARVEWIAARRRAGDVVFVHCYAGVSRSVLVVTAYLMSEHHWDRARALAFVRSRRPNARPNPAFLKCLLDWECALKERAG